MADDTTINLTLVILISAALSVALFAPMVRAINARRTGRRTLASLGLGSMLLIVWASVGMYFLISALLSYLPNNFGDYDSVVDMLTQGPPLLQFAAVGLLAPVAEELCMRGIVLTRLRRIMPVPAAIAVQALLFGILHWNFVQGSYAFVLGLFLGWLYVRTRTIAAPILFHILFNSCSSLLSLLVDPAAVTELPAGQDVSMPFYALIFLLANAIAPILLLSRRLPRLEIDRPAAGRPAL